MYSFQCDFFPDFNKANLMSYYDTLTNFLTALSRNGQIVNNHWNIVFNEAFFRLYCTAIDRDSLEPKYFNKCCHQYFSRLSKISKKRPEYRLNGEAFGLTCACSCADPSHYILFTTHVAEFPPVTCGDCHRPVPMYKLPKLDGDEDYFSLFQWEAEYQAFDSLFMLGDVGARLGYRQTAEADSRLTLKGINLCQQMTKKTGKPFYYFLRKYYTPPKSDCPLCGGNWVLDHKIHGLYAYKCDRCHLLSEKSS